MTGTQRAEMIGLARGIGADAGTPNPWDGYSAQALAADLGFVPTLEQAHSWDGMAIVDTLANSYESAYLAAHPIAHRDYERRDGFDRAAEMNGSEGVTS
jgi:hypothetical protein